MLTIEEIKSAIERLERRLTREETQCKNTRIAIAGAKQALKMIEKDDFQPQNYGLRCRCINWDGVCHNKNGTCTRTGKEKS